MEKERALEKPQEKTLEIDRDKLVEEEQTILSKFRGKAGLMARAFVLLTFLATSKPIEKAVIKGEHIKEPEKIEQVYEQEQFKEKDWENYISEIRHSPGLAAKNEYYKHLPKRLQKIALQTFEEAAKDRPHEILGDLVVNYYKKLPNKERILQQAATSAALTNPHLVLYCAEDYKERPYMEKTIKTATGNSCIAALECIRYYGDLLKPAETKKIVRESIEEAIQNYPSAVLAYLDRYKDYLDQSQIQKSIETATKNDPLEAVILLERRNDIREILERSNDPAIKVILDIHNSDLSHPLKNKVAILAQKILSDNMSLEEASEIVLDEQKLFLSLIEIKSQPNHLAKNTIELALTDLSLRKVQTINELHDASDAKRFESVKNASAEELYTLMTYGEEEVFTSSFNGLFDRLLERMKKDSVSGDQLLEKLGHNKFRTFIKLNAGFNRLNDFLATIDKDSQKDLLENFVKGLDKEKNKSSQAVAIADTFSMIKDPEVLKIFQKTIKEEYDRVSKGKNRESKAIYGLLAGMFGKRAIINEAWLKEMAEKYRLPDLAELSSSELFNQDKTNIQQYFFYDDKDGRASFQSLFAQYRNKPEWNIEEKENYITIKSSKEGGKIEIYANRPDKEDEGPEEIAKVLKEKNIQTIVIVHRGHSYHVQSTIERIPPIAKIVSLGSCGGYNNVDAVLKKAPEAHIISTKGTGTMFVNDPLFKVLNEEILSGRNINWPKFWIKAEKQVGKVKGFKDYVPPHKNLGVVFLKAYNKIISQQK